jgi:hypothetical protein
MNVLSFSRLLITTASLLCALSVHADAIRQTKGDHYDAFRQLDVDLPTPNVYRTASGAPGDRYWQQKVDYKIKVDLDETARRINASETVRYTNNSPDTLRYLWVQLDQNRFSDNSIARRSETAFDVGGRRNLAEQDDNDALNFSAIARQQALADTVYGYDIKAVVDGRGKALSFTVVDTMMRVDLPAPLASGKSTSFRIDFAFNIINETKVSGRGGYDHFEENNTDIFFLAQWFPRLAAYTDYAGWQHKAFLGSGEFTLEFGDYEVEITVPSDHIVSSTGILQNPGKVLTAEQRNRLNKAETAEQPIFIVTPEEAAENEKTPSTERATWVFKAENVRDFSWASSNKFIWDAKGHKQAGARQPLVMAMSFYPNEAEPIWSKYSTQAVLHTLEVYSRFSFDYPYPTAQSVNAWARGGMEYPMITFNGYRPEKLEPDENDEVVEGAPDSTYSRRVKYGLVGVIIHEIGHIYFPMTVNSDERQWTWMDEGINSFLDYVSALEWEENYPSYAPHTNVLDYIPDYMVGDEQVPIMTQSDSVLNLGDNAYSKPTAALIILRETVLGRELFDFAFKEYSRRWMFKRPTPSDFFRSMEDASGVDLDWFWRGWFYSTDHVDIAISDVREYKIASMDPDLDYPLDSKEYDDKHPETLAQIRNREEGRKTWLQRHPEVADQYNQYDRFSVSNQNRNDYQDFIESLEPWEHEALERAVKEDKFIYFVDFDNLGGLVMPLPLKITDVNGASEFVTYPAETWRRDYHGVTKVLIRDTALASLELDTRHETADANYSNNNFPQRISKSRLQLYKDEEEDRNLMAEMLMKLRAVQGGDDPDLKQVPLENPEMTKQP